MDGADIAADLKEVLSHVTVRPRRLLLDTPGVAASVPMLRGVWGAALHGLDAEVWRIVFEGRGAGSMLTPSYILRPAPPAPETAPAIEWVGFGSALPYDAVLLRAWDVASGLGLGPERCRFFMKSVEGLHPDGEASVPGDAPLDWTLDRAVVAPSLAPVTPAGARGSCTVRFDAPLRLIREGRLVTAPTLTDVVLGGLRRLRVLVPEHAHNTLRRLWGPALDIAGTLPAQPWRGQRLDMVRWSGRQQTELELRGIAGALELPEGAGPLLPLLAALQWLHIGKGTVFGLGQVRLTDRGQGND